MISKLLIFSAIFAVTSGTNNIVSLNCGTNNVTKSSNEQFYSFNREVNAGSITFNGIAPEKIDNLNFLLYRGLGNAFNMDNNATLLIKFNANAPTQFYTMPLDNNKYTQPKKFESCGLAQGQTNHLKIEISPEHFKIFEGETFLQNYLREIDSGAYLKAAGIIGNFNLTSIHLECQPKISIEEGLSGF